LSFDFIDSASYLLNSFPMDRTRTLERVRQRTTPWDVVVIGGGATGVGCALDAAGRGCDVLLLEQHDLGKGTSSRSTKLIHGGVRYLRQGDLPLVRESLRERGMLLNNAPHAVHEQPFVIPCYSIWEKAYYGIGMKVYDLMAGQHRLGRSKVLSRNETIRHLPAIRSEGLSGGVLYCDCRFDDTQLLIDMASTASDLGAAVLNYARVDSFVKDSAGKITGLTFQDAETMERITVSARAVINAGGAFCDAVRAMSDAASKPLVTYSQGIHLVFDREFLPGEDAILIPKSSDGRVLFCIPWHEHLLIGTTDTPVDSALLEPQALETEIDFVLTTAGRYLVRQPSRDDILSVFAGIRPLASRTAVKNTSALSRGHVIETQPSGLVTVTGGKWTTYRQMAEDAVDQAMANIGDDRGPSTTAGIRIKDTNSELNKAEEPSAGDNVIDRAFVINAIRTQMARTVEDVLARRSRLLFIDARAAIDAAPFVAKIIAEELGKDEEWVTAEINRFNEVANNYLPAGKRSTGSQDVTIR
jgi:glycerol-3-phosphate dehydrogenase